MIFQDQERFDFSIFPFFLYTRSKIFPIFSIIKSYLSKKILEIFFLNLSYKIYNIIYKIISILLLSLS